MIDAEMRRMVEELLSRTPGPPPGPPSGPPVDRSGPADEDGPMEKRLSAVEHAVIRIDGRLGHIDSRLNHIEHEVSQTKWWVAGSTLTILLAMVATVLGTGVAIQQMTVATFQGAAQQQKDVQPQPAQLPPIIINVPAAAQPASSVQR